MHSSIPKRLLALCLFALSTCLAAGQSPDARIANLSTRAFCQTGDAVLVAEFIVQGAGRETLLLRGLGPSLVNVPNALRDPTIALLDARGRQLDFNNDWMQNPDKQEIIDTGLAPTIPREAAVIDTLSPGAYAAIVQGTRSSEGSGLVEIYDFGGGSELSAVGIRAFVSTGDDVIISGIIIIGTDPLPLLIRALGSSLADSGLPGVLPDPTLELHDGTGAIIATNDNWRDTQAAEIEATGLAPDHDRESGILVTVAPGAYTAVVAGVGGTTGLGFVQFYSLAAPIRELNPAPIIRRRR